MVAGRCTLGASTEGKAGLQPFEEKSMLHTEVAEGQPALWPDVLLPLPLGAEDRGAFPLAPNGRASLAEVRPPGVAGRFSLLLLVLCSCVTPEPEPIGRARSGGCGFDPERDGGMAHDLPEILGRQPLGDVFAF